MSFAWPWQYSFPPFFTLQPNGETRQKQLSAWCALALAYSQRHRLPAMTVREAQDSPLFANRRLQRILWGLPPPPPGAPHMSLLPPPAALSPALPSQIGERLLNPRPGKLPLESIQVVLEELRKNGNLEWLDKNKTSFLIMWRRPEEWGKLIYQWVSKNGLTNSVFTLYELASGDDTENEEFHGLDETMLLRALQALQQEHKAEIITLDDGRGVKFF
ncbi:vacuolar protein-sorting-associated protein 25 isoform X3 [Grus americana]|nr:vacuolar protein-sorting-associated protein 25 isoform X3 [Grus americana]XP_054657337.1 vacuolar protein-sorting-associated protein 25 isoform X3 [Grus americana]XP_054657338.1 vacuolar protein-sorting-associated protein 25 isoform X3 [Grus americana]XP_054657339.1 vacuolar protein-sorting-associated protein 25 isoform X3 [Grus americana]